MKFPNRKTEKLSISEDCKRILIVKLSSIGDVVMTTPVARELRAAFPDSYIAWVVDDKSQDVLIGNPYLDEVIVWKRRAGAKSFTQRVSGFFGGLAEIVPKLRARKFDIAIDFQGLARSALVISMSGARHKVGYDNAREGATLFYDMHLPSRELRTRGPQQYLNMLQLLNIYSEDLSMHMPIGDDDREFARAFLAEASAKNPGRKLTVSLCPATTWAHKHWTDEGWARLADLLISEYNVMPIFIASGADSPRIDRIRGMMNHQAESAAGKTTLKQAAAIIEQGDLTLTVDTGLMHISMALNRPTVGMFGPTRWKHIIGREAFSVVVKDFPCMPCLRHPVCKHVDCMQAITPEDVLKAAEPWLTGKGSSETIIPKSQKNIVFVSYYGHQSRLFKPMAEAASMHAKVNHLKIYPLTLERVITSIFNRCEIDEDQLDDITRYYRLKKTLKHPELDTPRWHARLRKRATDWYHLFRRKLAGADMLVVWNGFSIPVGAAVAAAKSLGIKTVFCENGVLPRMIAMDTQGINYANSISGKPAEFFENINVDAEKAKELFGTALQQRPLRKAALDASEGSDDDKPLPERYVLFAMQVHDDTQVVLFSPRFSSLKEAVIYTAEQITEYNARTGDTLKLVVKEHPSDFGRADYAELREALPDAYFLRKKPIREIIGDAKAVITLNSSVGVEGLLYLRPVITLGDAFYNVPGMLHHLGQDEDLADTLTNVVDKPVNTELITKFLYFLRYEYLVPLSQQPDGSISFNASTERIMDILYDKLSWTK